MSAKSKSQYKKVLELYKDGQITKEQLSRFLTVDYKKLPKRKK